MKLSVETLGKKVEWAETKLRHKSINPKRLLENSLNSLDYIRATLNKYNAKLDLARNERLRIHLEGNLLQWKKSAKQMAKIIGKL